MTYGHGNINNNLHLNINSGLSLKEHSLRQTVFLYRHPKGSSSCLHRDCDGTLGFRVGTAIAE